MPDSVTITIDGKVQDLDLDLLEVEVDTHVHLPGMFVITVEDEIDHESGRLVYADADTVFKAGAEVKIVMETDEIPGESRPVQATLIIGEITAIEPIFSEQGRPVLQIRGYDRLHRLSRGKKTRTYGDANPSGQGVTDDQIVRTIANETQGLSGASVDTSGLSGIKYPYVMQCNQTDLDFLWSRAALYGYQVYVEDKTLHFQKADHHRGSQSDKPAVLTWHHNLSSFTPRLTLMRQVDQAVVGEAGMRHDVAEPALAAVVHRRHAGDVDHHGAGAAGADGLEELLGELPRAGRVEQADDGQHEQPGPDLQGRGGELADRLLLLADDALAFLDKGQGDDGQDLVGHGLVEA